MLDVIVTSNHIKVSRAETRSGKKWADLAVQHGTRHTALDRCMHRAAPSWLRRVVAEGGGLRPNPHDDMPDTISQASEASRQIISIPAETMSKIEKDYNRLHHKSRKSI